MINIRIVKHLKKVKIEQGDCVVIYGDSGVGKTTLLRSINNDFDQAHQLQWSSPDELKEAKRRAPLSKYDVYLFDEPLGLPIGESRDREEQIEILTLIKQLNDKGKTIIMTTHDGAGIGPPLPDETRIIEFYKKTNIGKAISTSGQRGYHLL